MSDPRYPIDRLETLADVTPEQRRVRIEEIRRTPAELRWALGGLDQGQLETPYRDEGWSVRQAARRPVWRARG